MPTDLFSSATTPEDRVVLAACRREVDPGELGREAERFSSWDVAAPLLQRFQAHHVTGLALAAYERCGLFDGLEAQTRDAFTRQLSRERRRSGLFAMEIERLSLGFEAAGIQCVALKGAGLSQNVYDSPAERFLSDVDLLVFPERVDATLVHLLEHGYANPWTPEALLGYRTYHYHVPVWRPDGMIVELHWDLVKPGRSYRLDPRGVIDRSIPLTGVDGALRTPCAEDQILHAVAQQLQDGFRYFSRTVDIDRLVAGGGLDWDKLALGAEESGLAPALAYALRVARHLLGTDCPAEVIERLSPGRVARFHLALFDPPDSVLRQRFAGHPATTDLLRFWLAQPDGGRLAVLAGLLREAADPEPLKKPWTLGDRQVHRSRRRRLVGLTKLTVRQILIYLRTLIGLPTRRVRSQMRFWSSQLNSSERL